MHSDADKQGLVQGMITGVRGLCNGLGPAMFGLIFSLFHVDLSDKFEAMEAENAAAHGGAAVPPHTSYGQPKPVGPNMVAALNFTAPAFDPEEAALVTHIVPGPPFVFGSLLVILALMVSAFIPEIITFEDSPGGGRRISVHRQHSVASTAGDHL